MSLKKSVRIPLALLLAGAILTSAQLFPGNMITAAAGENKMTNISKGTEYMFSYRNAMTLTGDDLGRYLTADFGGKPNHSPTYVTIKNDTRSLTDWWDRSSDVGLFDEKDPFFYIKNDFGFVAEVHKTSISFAQGRDIEQPHSVEVFYSNDGYNYSYYGGRLTPAAGANSTITYSADFKAPIKAKSVKYVVYAPLGFQVAVTGIESLGKKLNERVLLSKGGKYTVDGESDPANRAGVLTDAAFGGMEEDDTYCSVSSKAVDPLHNTDAQYYTLDLGAVKHISEIQVSSLVDANMGMMSIRYIRTEVSADGKAYQDFCVAPLYNRIGGPMTGKEYFKAMRNHTVPGRYVRVSVFVTGFSAIDEISVFGSATAVVEPAYGLSENPVAAQTDIARGKTVSLNGASAGSDLTDGKFRFDNGLVKSKPVIPADKKILLEIDLGKVEGSLAGIELSLDEDASKNIGKITAYASANGSAYGKAGSFDKGFVLSGLKTYRLDAAISARYIRLEIETTDNSAVKISQLQIFDKTPQRAVVRGGWYSYYMNSSDSSSLYYKYDEYMMYILLKGFKELGMDYVIGPGIIEYDTKTTLDETPAQFKALGYKQGKGRGVRDFYTALFNAADKLGMRVYMGAIMADNYPYITGNKGQYFQTVLDETLPMLEYNYAKYKNHRSFAGFYFSHETCDQWLAEGNDQGVVDFRLYYKGQSDVIRRLDPALEIVAAPAIWRASTPARLENNMYNLLKGENGGRPIIDIISAQDCLGRLPSIKVDNGTYNSYELFLRALSNGTVRAGAKYFSDIEVFDVHYKTKRYTEIIDALNLHSRYTDGNLVFDIVNYMSYISRGSFNNFLGFDTEHIMQQYIKYLHNGAKEINDMGFSGTPVKLRIVNSDSEDFTKKLSGSVFKLVNSKNKLVGTLTTDKNGIAEIAYSGNLNSRLTLVQTEVNSVYLRRSEDIRLNITRESMFEKDGSGYTYVMKIANNKKGAAVTISAVDSQDDELGIDGAVFEISDADGKVVQTVTTGSDGVIRSKTLALGKYGVRQTKTAADYKVNQAKAVFSLTKDGQNVEIVYKNHNLNLVSPDTPDPEPEVSDEEPAGTGDEDSDGGRGNNGNDAQPSGGKPARKKIVEYETVINTKLIILLSGLGVLLIGGAATAAVLLKKKKSKTDQKL